MPLSAYEFETLLAGRRTGLFFLKKERLQCAITNYGARLVQLLVPDKYGNEANVVLGYAALQQYRQLPEDYMGAVVGRCANRIAGAAFDLDGRHYQLVPNEGPNLLHSGPEGLHSRVWQVMAHSETSLTLGYLSPDGEGGFPGTLNVTVTYQLETAGVLSIHYTAVAAAATIVNLSHHAYFNLSGAGSRTAMDHYLQLPAQYITPVDEALIPTGALMPVAGTPFDFRQAKPIGQDVAADHRQLRYGHGYDHNFVLEGKGMKQALSLWSPVSGIRLQLFTDQPGLQFYSGNYLDGSRTGIGGQALEYRSALALEPQHFPDAVHHPGFPSVVLQPPSVFESTSRYLFDVAEAP